MTKTTKPKLGIFWYFNKGLITYSMPAGEVKEEAGFRDVDMGHFDFWPRVQALHKRLTGLEYDQIPRGRVLYDGQRKIYKVYSSAMMIGKEAFRKSALAEFGLPATSTVFESDFHYEPPDHIDWKD